jgi:hypothetical protein
MAIALRAPTNPTLVIETTNVFVRSDRTEIPTKNAHPAAIKLTMSPTTSRMRKSLNTGIGIVINCRHRNCASDRQPARPKTVLFIMRSNYWLGDGTAIIEVRSIGVQLQRAATGSIESVIRGARAPGPLASAPPPLSLRECPEWRKKSEGPTNGPWPARGLSANFLLRVEARPRAMSWPLA